MRSKYTADEIDAVAAYCEDFDECYLLPVELFDGNTAAYLRVAPAQKWPAGAAKLCGLSICSLGL